MAKAAANPTRTETAPVTTTDREALLITVTGIDKPGITAEIAKILDDASAELLDVEQVVVHGRLILHFLVCLDAMGSHPVLKELLWKTRELGLDLDLDVVDPVRDHTPQAGRRRFAITLVAPGVGAGVLGAAAAAVAQTGFNIDRIERLSEGRLSSIELLVSGDEGADARTLKTRLLEIERRLPCDIALQRESLLRRSKRLVVMDMDSTLIQQEVIDELARLHGVYDEVSQVTERAMQGELPFGESLKRRCALLAGAPESVFRDVLERIEFTPGAEHFVGALKRLGYKTAVVSGGFIQVAEPLRQKLGLDYAFANHLEVEDGVLTGRVIGPVVDRARKADLLESMAQAERISLEAVIAIGDGANDLDMLDRAGLGIAFNAKKVVQEAADTAINQKNLDAVLYLLGIREEDLRAVSA
ncbi:MAG: phosphoserine phosphatase SerB [Deltaproteobacteria bacterium]|nr:phosphoserine phosphatase SerB [Deltaproteobacteria bacterium]